MPLQDPPSRQPWEEPPKGGWSSHLSGVGLETLWVLTSAAIAVGVVRLIGWARFLGQRPNAISGWHHALVVALWCAACVLSAGVLVFIWRRLGGLALIGAMLTDYGRVARLGGRPPVWLDETPEQPLRIAHLSDLHINEGDDVRMVERATPGGNLVLPSLLDHPEVAKSDVLLFTGDTTDRGTAVSWRCFLDALEERGLQDRAILVPGNHDIALVDPLEGLRERNHVFRADRFGIVQLANLLKFAEAFNETGGGRHGFVLSAKGDALVPFEDAWVAAERAVRPLVAALPLLPVPPMRLRSWRRDRPALAAYTARIDEARDHLLALFPIAVPIPGHDAVVFVLNSCASLSRHPSTNALGHVGRAQYRRLERMSRFCAQKLKLVALHHHVVRRGEERVRDLLTRLLAKFTVLGDVRPLVRFCRTMSVRAVMNGHRHLSYQLRLPNGTVLLAAPSSTLGDELADDPRPQFTRYDISREPDGRSVGIFRQVIRPTA